MKEPSHKYPSTPHLPWSPGLQNDDRRITSLAGFTGREVVVTEKLDGESCTMLRTHLHARSLDTRPHPSRDRAKALRGRFGHDIPPGWRLCGENVYAMHSIYYTDLEDYYYLFSVWDDQNVSRPWDEVLEWAALLGVPTPREFYRGPWEAAAIEGLHIDTQTTEGYVVRVTGEIPYATFDQHVAKYVREGHVQTDEHWLSRPVVPNLLRGQEQPRTR